MTIRDDVLSALESFLAGWAGGDSKTLGHTFHASSSIHSSAHGEAVGAENIAALLAADRGMAMPLQLVSTNEYVAGNDSHTVLTAYLFGHVADPTARAPAVFGAVLVADLTRGEDGWRFRDLKLSIPWTDGDTSRFSDWNGLPGRGWKLGDPTPTIVSELDSPWARGVPPLSSTDAVQQVADAYARYAWAIDQGDFGLLSGCYTEDAFGEFPPMGHRDGRHEIIGQQKEFRRHWPWMQHFGRPLSIEVDEHETTAHMVIGRVIPQQPLTPDGQDLYGAHYKLDLRLEHGAWKISYFDYRPGWITTK
ncbi:hypothetical protein ASF98_21900 [Arthrobacter sp. Leaf337]|nr:hypothetical protein ASF98_21900 [Arthrobacter sp. Leaf337]